MAEEPVILPQWQAYWDHDISLYHGLIQVHEYSKDRMKEVIRSNACKVSVWHEELDHHFGQHTSQKAPATMADNLTTTLLSGYNKDVIPVVNPMLPIIVYPVIAIYQIINLDGKDQILSFAGSIGMGWHDAHLGWDPNNYAGIALTTLPLEYIWKPDIGIQNSVDGDLFDLSENRKNRVQIIGPSYLVMWQAQRVFTISCPLDMTYFPFDTQTCTIRLVSTTLPSTHMRLANITNTLSFDYYQESSEWEVVSSGVTLGDLNFIKELQFTGVDVYSVFTAELKLKRRSGYYTTHLILPCVFISLLTSITFYIPSEAGEKISFSVTLLLAFTVYQLIIAESLPKSSETTPLLSIYLTILIAMSASSVFLAMIVLNVHHHNPKKPVPSWLRNLIFKFLGTIVFKRKAVRNLWSDTASAKVHPSPTMAPEGETIGFQSSEANNHGFEKRKGQIVDSTLPWSPSNIKDHDISGQVRESSFGSAYNLPTNKGRGSGMSASSGDLHRESRDLRTPSDLHCRLANVVDGADCWILAAEILDRFFMWSYLVILVTTSLVLLVILPSMYA
ncbi:neuronal acetylcholine receptor subunit alpha-10-like [Lineus longissimus]|uniref:neuronal acetylcholine receptor subunit alpha-10-like n=1 Tax=Lineus longissimus TaxID=88925 RepID=UPI00315DDD92